MIKPVLLIKTSPPIFGAGAVAPGILITSRSREYTAAAVTALSKSAQTDGNPSKSVAYELNIRFVQCGVHENNNNNNVNLSISVIGGTAEAFAMTWTACG